MNATTAPRITRPAAVSSGLLAGAAALAGGELVASFVSRWQSPVVAVAEAFIDRVPRAMKDFAIETFGGNDKIALVVGILIVSMLLAVVLGFVGRTRPLVTRLGLVGFAVVGAWASQQAADSRLSGIVPSMAAGAVGLLTYDLLRSRAPRPADSIEYPQERPTSGTDRRSFLLTSGSVGAGAAFMAVAGRALSSRLSAAASRAGLKLPRAASPLPAAPASITAPAEGVSPFFTPNEAFYRVDTALSVPQVRVEDWSLRIHGMVDREITMNFEELVARGVVEQDMTLTCVSNTVGGNLLGTARWLGVPLQQLLDDAGVQAGADQIVGRSVDGYTCGFPVAALDGRPAFVAVGMNGEPLPVEHGFPARLLVAGLYGYVSATKWLTELELTTFDAFDQYWVERGWDEQAPIKASARIDTPKSLQKVTAGTVPVAGVAWAQTRGISKVEVSVDDGEWTEATLADEQNIDTWRQWSFPWEATPGRHRITVRATDGNGDLQIEERADPFPNGASGWMSLFVEVVAA